MRIDNQTRKVLDSMHAFRLFTKDGGISGLTGTNIGVAGGALTSISPDIIEVITRKRMADEVIGNRQVICSWQQDDVQFNVLEATGETKPYSDFDNAPVSNINVIPVKVGHARHNTKIQVGNLMALQQGEMGVNAEQEAQAAALENLAIWFNYVAFFGEKKPEGSRYNVNGFINHPGLDPAEDFQFTGTLTYKKAYDSLIGLVQNIVTKSKGHASYQTPFVLALASNLAYILTIQNDMGTQTVQEALMQVCPNMKIVLASELNGAEAGLDAIYLRAEEDGVARVNSTAILGYSELALMGQVETYSNYYSQDVSSGSCGTIIRRPYMIARAKVTK